MRIESIFCWLFFVVGSFGLIIALITKDTWLLGLSTLLWVGMIFFEMVMIKDKLNMLNPIEEGEKKE